jgi:diguanylate cyclase (GGDEF)-like protein/PAS domain S-box-containing protein
MKPAETLTERERAVLEMLATPRTYAQIARELVVSTNTVKSHVSHLYMKLGVTSRCGAIERAQAAGLLPDDESDAGGRRRFEALVMHGRDLITIVDAQRRLVWANPAFRDMLGKEPDEYLGRPAWEIVHPDDRNRLGSLFAEVSKKPGASVTFECRLSHADGSWRQVEVHQVNRLDDPAVRGFVGNARDVGGRVAIAEQLAVQAMHDPLTGLANRVLFTDRLHQALARVHRRAIEATVMFVDLDGFKRVNDTYGHGRGDLVLEQIARRLVEVVRPGDTVARFGGDEFVVLIEDGIGATNVTNVANRIREAVRDPIRVDGETIVVTCSVGVAGSEHHNPRELLHAADLAMYRAKHDGRDRVEIALAGDS